MQPAGLPEISDLFSRAWDIYRERFATLTGLSFLMVLFFILPIALAAGSGYGLSKAFPEMKLAAIALCASAGIIMSMITIFWGMAGLLSAVADKSLSLREALSAGWPKTAGLIWLLSLLGFLATGGFLLFFVPGVIFLVWFSFGQFVLVDENTRGMTALLRSKEYVKGFVPDVFLRLFLIWIFSGLVGGVPFIGPILSIFFMPYSLTFCYLIYRDLRALKGEVSAPATACEKFKWLGTATLGYLMVPLILAAIFGASLVTAFFLLKGLMSKPAIDNLFSAGRPVPGISSQPPPVTLPAPPPSFPEAAEDVEIPAARAAYKRFTEAYRQGRMDEAKSFISRTTLADMEQSGMVETAMGMIGGSDIDDFQASREGDIITFRQSKQEGSATMSMSFTMVREDNRWKLGKQ